MATPAKRRARGPAGEQGSHSGSGSSEGSDSGSDSGSEGSGCSDSDEPIDEVSGTGRARPLKELRERGFGRGIVWGMAGKGVGSRFGKGLGKRPCPGAGARCVSCGRAGDASLGSVT